ncbi:MAG: NADH-ubiquinone oxidoreductase-F iron-sulfur binding region domain-containing protein [Thermodesulfobacteriota bacterium]|nr:NADH-ubiquinone oxidoreductase-F iron-sulfur binding region domain-containing protein [Thermodesulfobacteriota bacterium]
MKRIDSPEKLEEIRQEIIAKRDSNKPCITICSGTGCRAFGCEKVTESFQTELKNKGLEEKIDIRTTGCHGFCERGPVVVLNPMKIFYQNVDVKDTAEIISETLLKDEIVDRLLYIDPQTGNKIVKEDDVPFYKGQTRHIFGNNGRIDPTSLEDYIAIGGYSALSKTLKEISPSDVIGLVKKSGLRGRGGGGFPTGVKWESCRRAPGDKHYVICNADEGDPGAYMDRSLLEGNPHSVLEGMIIGAYAIGSDEGYIYVRNEYPLAVKNVEIAINQLRNSGLLGEKIFNTEFSFDIKVSKGGGAFVCGESTALMESLEGRAGEPRAKHIHTVESGLWDQPTNLNNVETWANIPLIINKGVDWYTGIGTEGSKGTKIFSLVGKVNNTGLVEVPMGITLREIVDNIGGGIPNERKLKAVQTGGPSGGVIPEKLLDIQVDFDKLTEVGSMMGSGGMIVMDDKTCMVDTAKYFMNFLKGESCGKCTTCREGTQRMYEILDAITSGEGKEGDIELLEELSWVVAEGSLCALGQTAPNPVLSTIRYFRDEYETHIKEKRCPAGVCKALITYSIDEEACTGCGMCKKVCPSDAITGEKKKLHVIDAEKCIRCGACMATCNFDAVKVV